MLSKINSEKIKLAVIGLGYVGLPLAVEFGKKFDVVGFDVKQTRLDALRAALTEAESGSLSAQARADYYRDTVIPAMEALRESADGLEVLVAKDLWPLPSYGDMLFSVR